MPKNLDQTSFLKNLTLLFLILLPYSKLNATSSDDELEQLRKMQKQQELLLNTIGHLKEGDQEKSNQPPSLENLDQMIKSSPAGKIHQFIEKSPKLKKFFEGLIQNTQLQEEIKKSMADKEQMKIYGLFSLGFFVFCFFINILGNKSLTLIGIIFKKLFLFIFLIGGQIGIFAFCYPKVALPIWNQAQVLF